MATMKYDGGAPRDAKPAAAPKKAAPSKSEMAPTKKQVQNKARVISANQKGQMPTTPPKGNPLRSAPKTGKASAAKTTTRAVKKEFNPKNWPPGDTRFALEMASKTKKNGRKFTPREIERRGEKRFGPDYGPA